MKHGFVLCMVNSAKCAKMVSMGFSWGSESLNLGVWVFFGGKKKKKKKKKKTKKTNELCLEYSSDKP